ncbi:YggL family protein [Vibrio palustris]|uniref:DUF469 domain-containing protein n=1 Tax=Vibrio palustris TaxID=1918946 RepID=A0A1R4B4D6_9VIBR|nr:50S ribosome-binding protein YggL [Vibrio palustris]SJL83782.1 hypothetical protein VPAL9027_01760 [Vibrio palustris]
MATNRSRRLRKKLLTGEFTVFGFELEFNLEPQDEAELHTFFDDFVEFIEGQDLMFGGSASNEKFNVFVMAGGRYDSVTETQQQAIESWLDAKPMCSNIKIGPLVDVNGDV